MATKAVKKTTPKPRISAAHRADMARVSELLNEAALDANLCEKYQEVLEYINENMAVPLTLPKAPAAKGSMDFSVSFFDMEGVPTDEAGPIVVPEEGFVRDFENAVQAAMLDSPIMRKFMNKYPDLTYGDVDAEHVDSDLS